MIIIPNRNSRSNLPDNKPLAEPSVTLSNLKNGDRAVITAIRTQDPQAAAKLASRGIVPGTRFGVLNAGDPCLIAIENDRWALTRAEAAGIQVEVVERSLRGLRALLRRIA